MRKLGLFVAMVALLACGPVLALSSLAPGSGQGFTAASSPSSQTYAELAALGGALLGTIRVKDAATVARKWTTRAAAAAGDYASGVKEAGADWEANTLAGKDNYAQGTQQAIADGRYERGVRDAGQQRYVTRASTLGASRFGPGVQAAEGEMQKGVAPVLDVIRSLNLPPRRPKGDPGNMERANFVATALRKFKVGR